MTEHASIVGRLVSDQLTLSIGPTSSGVMFFITEDVSEGEPALMKLHENPFSHHIEHPGRLETIEDVARTVELFSCVVNILVELGMDRRQYFCHRRATSSIWLNCRLHWSTRFS